MNLSRFDYRVCLHRWTTEGLGEFNFLSQEIDLPYGAIGWYTLIPVVVFLQSA